jgi:hypothetical protein
MLANLNLPKLPVRLKQENGVDMIFDPIRKKWLHLTPEEWVRQSFVLFMHTVHHYPLSLIETEKQLKLNNTRKRADIVFYDNTLKARIIVECKAPEIKLNKDVLEQLSRYYFSLKTDLLIITNGMEHYAFRFLDDKVEFMHEIPDFSYFQSR